MKKFIVVIVSLFIIIYIGKNTVKYIHGISMLPTFHNGDIVIHIPFSNIKKGDILIAINPDGKKVIKRVGALAGEKIIIKNSLLYILDKGKFVSSPSNLFISKKQILKSICKLSKSELNIFLKNNYKIPSDVNVDKLTSFPNKSCVKSNKTYTIPKDNYFLIGDNRDFSKDSRYYGSIQSDKIIGKVIFSF